MATCSDASVMLGGDERRLAQSQAAARMERLLQVCFCLVYGEEPHCLQSLHRWARHLAVWSVCCRFASAWCTERDCTAAGLLLPGVQRGTALPAVPALMGTPSCCIGDCKCRASIQVRPI